MTSSRRVDAALQLGQDLAALSWAPPAPHRERVRRRVALGDPRAEFRTVLTILDQHDVLGDDGLLRPDVSLLSIGNHFDFGTDRPSAAQNGLQMLRWLAAHSAEQVTLIAGNHDMSRVKDLALDWGENFAKARAELAEPNVTSEDFVLQFPRNPRKIAVHRYLGFTDAQRDLVQALLVAGRFRLARVASSVSLPNGPTVAGPVLFTHAGVTHREIGMLDLGTEVSNPIAICDALNETLRAAVHEVRELWQPDRDGHAWLASVNLHPLHRSSHFVMTESAHCGGGLLDHQPAHPTDGEERWLWNPEMPLRYDPRTLPLGLRQACGHVGHGASRRDLAPWATEEALARAYGGVRTLSTDGVAVRYAMGLHELPSAHAALYMLDGEMFRVPPEEYQLIEVGEWLDEGALA